MNFLETWTGKLFILTFIVAIGADVLHVPAARSISYREDLDAGFEEFSDDPFMRYSSNGEISWTKITILCWIGIFAVSYKLEEFFEKRRKKKMLEVALQMENDAEWQEHRRRIMAASDPIWQHQKDAKSTHPKGQE